MVEPLDKLDPRPRLVLGLRREEILQHHDGHPAVDDTDSDQRADRADEHQSDDEKPHLRIPPPIKARKPCKKRAVMRPSLREPTRSYEV